MKCPRCQSDNTRKDGHANGKQRWECKDCGRLFRDSYSTKGYHPQVKQICLTMYLNGMGFRGIERVTGIHHTRRCSKQGYTSRGNYRLEQSIYFKILPNRRAISNTKELRKISQMYE